MAGMSGTSFNVTTRCPKTGNVCSLLLCSNGTAINCQLYPGPNNPDMFDDKTSEQEIKEQIERDRERESFRVPYNGTDNFYNEDFGKGYEKGATAQDKIATNRTVEAAIAIVKLNSWRLDSDDDLLFFIAELEKLRR